MSDLAPPPSIVKSIKSILGDRFRCGGARGEGGRRDGGGQPMSPPDIDSPVDIPLDRPPGIPPDSPPDRPPDRLGDRPWDRSDRKLRSEVPLESLHLHKGGSIRLGCCGGRGGGPRDRRQEYCVGGVHSEYTHGTPRVNPEYTQSTPVVNPLGMGPEQYICLVSQLVPDANVVVVNVVVVGDPRSGLALLFVINILTSPTCKRRDDSTCEFMAMPYVFTTCYAHTFQALWLKLAFKKRKYEKCLKRRILQIRYLIRFNTCSITKRFYKMLHICLSVHLVNLISIVCTEAMRLGKTVKYYRDKCFFVVFS
ncbi:hypothetical protein FOCC_FOCC003735 [Frankliniella occidentalis]|nr:hypothetical protein FOCC_FOCC003735 [Frankliniella occidentalis]